MLTQHNTHHYTHHNNSILAYCIFRVLEANEITLNDELQTTKVRLEKLKLEIANTDQVNEELMKRMDAESENAKLAQDRAESAIQHKEQLEQQLDKLQEAYEKSLKRCEVLCCA